MEVGNIVYSHVVQKGYVKAAGQEVYREDYPLLYQFAQENELLLSEADWANGRQGMYSLGDGHGTFRVPDLRGQFLRALDDGAGMDAGRILGSKQRGSLTCFDWDTRTSEIAGVGSERGLHGDVGFDVLEINEYPNAKCCWISGTTLQSPLREEAIGVSRPKNIALIAQIKY